MALSFSCVPANPPRCHHRCRHDGSEPAHSVLLRRGGGKGVRVVSRVGACPLLARGNTAFCSFFFSLLLHSSTTGYSATIFPPDNSALFWYELLSLCCSHSSIATFTEGDQLGIQKLRSRAFRRRVACILKVAGSKMTATQTQQLISIPKLRRLIAWGSTTTMTTTIITLLFFYDCGSVATWGH